MVSDHWIWASAKIIIARGPYTTKKRSHPGAFFRVEYGHRKKFWTMVIIRHLLTSCVVQKYGKGERHPRNTIYLMEIIPDLKKSIDINLTFIGYNLVLLPFFTTHEVKRWRIINMVQNFDTVKPRYTAINFENIFGKYFLECFVFVALIFVSTPSLFLSRSNKYK